MPNQNQINQIITTTKMAKSITVPAVVTEAIANETVVTVPAIDKGAEATVIEPTVGTQRATTPNEYTFEMFSQMASLGELSPETQVKADEIADLYDSILQTFPQGQRELYIACNQYINNPFDAWVWVGASERASIVTYCTSQRINYIVCKLIENVI